MLIGFACIRVPCYSLSSTPYALCFKPNLDSPLNAYFNSNWAKILLSSNGTSFHGLLNDEASMHYSTSRTYRTIRAALYDTTDRACTCLCRVERVGVKEAVGTASTSTMCENLPRRACTRTVNREHLLLATTPAVCFPQHGHIVT